MGLAAMIVQIAAVGARCPLGLSAMQVAMCLRARKIEPLMVRVDGCERPVGLCCAGGIGAKIHGHARKVALAAPALSEALHNFTRAEAAARGVAFGPQGLPLFLSAPPLGRPDDATDRDLIADIAERSGAPVDARRSRVVRAGHAGFCEALRCASEAMDAGAPIAVVGGVDSYYHPELLRRLDADGCLVAPENDDGFIPSEAAAFLVLARAMARAAPLGLVTWFGQRDEPSAGTDAPPAAEAMTLLMAEHARAVGAPQRVVIDCNGERWRQSEWDLACQRGVPLGVAVERWVTDLGDTGAATGALFASAACCLWQAGAENARRITMALHSAGRARGVVVLERPFERGAQA